MSDLPDPAQEKRELQDEVERLRTALAKIATPMAGNPDLDNWRGLAEYRAQVAENALNKTTTDPNET